MGYYMAVFGDHQILKKMHRCMVVRAKSLKEAEVIVKKLYHYEPTYIFNTTGKRIYRVEWIK